MMHRLITIFILHMPGALLAAEPAWDRYAELLGRHLSEGEKAGVQLTLVDYQGIAADSMFPEIVREVREFDVTTLASKDEKLAFYINAYNILTIQLILDHWPVDSIRDIGNFFRGPWDIVMLRNADGDLTLDDIEHEIIRPLGEPRIHFAVNCASVSCPDLRSEPYTAAQLDLQLTDQTRLFLANPGKGLAVENGAARVTKLFDWYEDDFGGVETFVRQYAQDIEFKRIRGFIEYDWSLNGSIEIK